MAEIKEHYNSKIEAQVIAKSYEDKNKAEGTTWRPFHDDFDDPDWKHGDLEIGTLTFTDEPSQAISTIDWKAEYLKAKTDTEKLAVLSKKLGLVD